MRMDHPNIVKIYEIIETETECYIVMYGPFNQGIGYWRRIDGLCHF
jgi:hypothetical protein